MYKQIKDPVFGNVCCVSDVETGTYIPISDPANTDYQRFKTKIEAGEAELQDSEGVTMSPEEAKAFVKELP